MLSLADFVARHPRLYHIAAGGSWPARAYRNQPKLLLTIDTAGLLERNAARVELSRINSGSTHPMPSPRSMADFIALERYLADGGYREHSPRRHFRELTVLGGVPDLAAFVLRADEYLPGEPPRTLHART